MKVLSLFDGISCAHVALGRRGIVPELYLASEIDPHAVAITMRNWPKTVQLGDIRNVHWDPALQGELDLLIGGSPCQDLSGAKRNRKGLDGDRSNLFYEYVRILKEARPRWFILENVASMHRKEKDKISEVLGVQPVMIDAALVSAQSRKRLFWTNIPGIQQPEDRGFTLRDIVEDVPFEDYDMKRHTGKLAHINIKKATRTLDRKMKTLGTQMRATVSNGTLIQFDDGKKRIPTPVECERAQCLPDGYTAGESNTQRYKGIGNGFNVDVIAHILSHIYE